MAVTPRDLLLGAAPSLPVGEDLRLGSEMDLEERTDTRLSLLEQKVELWWSLYSQDAFPLLVPFQKWSRTAEVVDLGAIVLVQYVSGFKKDRYRLARVVELEESRDGLVRSVVVILRNRSKGAREHRNVCRAGVTRMRLPVQRLVVVLPGKEQPQELIEGLRAAAGQVPEGSQGPRRQERRLRVRQDSGEEEIMDIV